MSRGHRCSRVLLIGLWISCVCLALSPSTAAALVDARWGDPVAVGPELRSSWFPDVTADASGEFWLTWEATLAPASPGASVGSGVFLSHLGAQGWSLPADVQTTDGSYAGRTTVISDGHWLHLLYRKEMVVGQNVRLWYIRAPLTANLADAHSWSAPRALSDDMAYYSQFALLPNGDLTCIFNQILPTEGANVTRRTGLLARRSSDHGATWTPAAQISDTAEQVARSGITLAPDGKTLLAYWDEGYENMSGLGKPKQVGLARSTDGGQTWADRQAVHSPLGAIEQGFVAYARGGPVLAYRSTVEDRLYYRSSGDDGRTWSDERPIDGTVTRPYTAVHHFDRFSLAADGDGNVFLAYVGADSTAPKGLAVMVVTYSEAGWSPPLRVAAPDGYPEYPRLAVALGTNIQLAYFVRDNLYDTGHYTLWVVAGQSSARPIPPVMPAGSSASDPVAVPTVAAAPVYHPQAYPAVPPPTPLMIAPGERFDPPLRVVALPTTQILRFTPPILVAVGLFALAIRRLFAARG